MTTPRSFVISAVSSDMLARPVLEDVERLAFDVRGVGRDLKLVDRLVEARRGVDVGPEAHADGLEVAHELVLREARRAVERHVLEEVREPALVVVLEDRTGVHDEPELGALLGLGVPADVVAEPVRQRADDDVRIARKRRGARRVDGRRARCRTGGALSERRGR